MMKRKVRKLGEEVGEEQEEQKKSSSFVGDEERGVSQEVEERLEERLKEVEEIGVFKDRISLPNLVDQSFVIQSVDYATSQFDQNRKCATLDCWSADHDQFQIMTSAMPIMRQLERLEEKLPVRVTVEAIPLRNGKTFRFKDIYKVRIEE